MEQTECGDKGQMDGFACLGLLDEDALFLTKLLLVVGRQGIGRERILHFTEVDDLIVPVDQQVDLCTRTLFIPLLAPSIHEPG